MSSQQRREQLIGVGRHLFARKGYEAVSVEEIASEAAVSKPVVYEHFGGKEGLYAVIVDREMNRLLEQITTSLTGDNPRLLLEQAGTACSTTSRTTPTASHPGPDSPASASGLDSLDPRGRSSRRSRSTPSSAPAASTVSSTMYAQMLVSMVAHTDSGGWTPASSRSAR
jgi:AcrR family transcriptional regulator